jgi:transposase
LQQRATEVDDNAYRLLLERQAQGYPGGDELVKRAVRPRRAQRDRRIEAPRRFETPPGGHAPVDWGSTWVERGGKRQQGHVFVMVLGYSRALDTEFTGAETLPMLLSCQAPAFDWCGGVPAEILYANPKTVVLHHDVAGRHITWNPQVWDFAQYAGFRPRACQP